MFLSINELTFGKNGDLESHIVDAAEAGFKFIEISKGNLLKYFKSGKTITDLKEVLTKTRLKVFSINAIERFNCNDAVDFSLVKSEAMFLFNICRELNCSHVEVIPSFNLSNSEKEIKESSVESLKQLGKLAKDFNINLALEFMAKKECSINTFKKALEIINEVNMNNVGILLDTWHFYVSGSKLEELENAKDKIKLVHLSDAPAGKSFEIPRTDSFFLGDGVIETEKIVSELYKIKYDNPFSIEIMSPDIQNMNSMDMLLKARLSTEEIMKKSFSL